MTQINEDCLPEKNILHVCRNCGSQNIKIRVRKSYGDFGGSTDVILFCNKCDNKDLIYQHD